MKITRSQLKQLIKEELDKRITNLAMPSMEVGG
jgi:ribosomal protein L29